MNTILSNATLSNLADTCGCCTCDAYYYTGFPLQTISSNAPGAAYINVNAAAASVYYVSSMTQNFSLNVSNVPTVEKTAGTFELVNYQGATGYYANALTLNGASTTFSFLNGSIPVPIARRIETQTFKFYYIDGAYKVVADYKSYA